MTLSSSTKHRPLATAAIAAGLVAAGVGAAVSAAAAGPAVGARVPLFEAQDQSGETRDFASLTGEKGLLLLFFRSADW